MLLCCCGCCCCCWLLLLLCFVAVVLSECCCCVVVRVFRPAIRRVLHVADCRVVVLSKNDEVKMECAVQMELEVTHQVTVRMNKT